MFPQNGMIISMHFTELLVSSKKQNVWFVGRNKPLQVTPIHRQEAQITL